mmetsp:Transcript_29719/g.62017  ORF Transcript_29719/g.62017 Transcript_29719/m.62017 type:complete len:141 (-) Transcript_29719:80-502(-)
MDPAQPQNSADFHHPTSDDFGADDAVFSAVLAAAAAVVSPDLADSFPLVLKKTLLLLLLLIFFVFEAKEKRDARSDLPRDTIATDFCCCCNKGSENSDFDERRMDLDARRKLLPPAEKEENILLSLFYFSCVFENNDSVF